MTNLDRNRAAWDRLAEAGSQFAKTATDQECANPLQTLDGRGWLPASVAGMDVLCLAAGGGWQSILYSAAGANVTVVDLSPSMLNRDYQESQRRGYPMTIVEGSMDDLSMLAESGFDIVHQPVSTCYVEDVERVFGEISRVIRPGGLYISQHKQPTSLQITHRTRQNHFVIGIEYYCTESLPQTEDTSYREDGTREYLHRWEQLIGGLCRAGFVIEDLTEPYRADPSAAVNHFGYRGRFIAPYLRIKARRTADPPEVASIWVPNR